MPTGDLERANGVMRIVGAKIAKQIEQVPMFYNWVGKGQGTKIGDRGIEIPTYLVPNPNHRWTTDGGDMPAGGSTLKKRAQVFFKNYVHSCRMTGGAIDTVNSGDVAYVKDFLQDELRESVAEAYKRINWYAVTGTGNGRLATISATATSATQTVNNNDKNRALRDGMVIDSVNTSTGVVGISGGTISTAENSSTTFLLAASATGTADEVVVMQGSYNLAITGLRAMVDDTTDASSVFQGISRVTYPQYKAFRVNASSVGLDVSYLRRVLGAGIHIKTGELNRGSLSLWSHPAQTAAYSALGWSLKRSDMGNKALDFGYTRYEYEGIDWNEDVDMLKDEINVLDKSTFKKYVAKEAGWDEKTGSILRQVPSSTSGIAYTDQFEGYWTFRFNLGCERPNKNGWVDALAVPTGF